MYTQTVEVTSQAASGHQHTAVPDQTVELGNVGLQSETSFGMTGATSRWQYGKVPHPVDRELRELPTVSGLDVEPLLQFLLKVRKLRDTFNVADRPLLELIHTFCKSPLRERVIEALRTSVDFDRFHEDVIQYVVPRRRFEQLCQDMFGRLQREEESLSAYAESIKDAATVLLALSETEVVAVIMDGLSPSQRSRLVFQKLPVTFRELDQLGTYEYNIRVADRARGQEVPSDYRTGMNRRTEQWQG